MAALRLGDTAPNFSAKTTEGEIMFHEWLGNKWGVLFSHPADFTPVCTTELGMVAKLKDEFDKRNVKVIGLSVDPLGSHGEWIKDINETQNTTVNFPMIADDDKFVSTLYDMIHPNADDKLTVLTYPASTGRNFNEILRAIDSLQLTSNYSVATPVNWKDGDDCIIVNSINDEDAAKKFPKGFKKIKPYLRLTPQPNK